jgi:hypothetical protein
MHDPRSLRPVYPSPCSADPAPVIHYAPADHGVKVRIYLDGTQLAERGLSKVFHDLDKTPWRRDHDQAHSRMAASQA